MNQDEFKKIISNAITQEVEAFTFYSSVSEKAKDENLKEIFKSLADDEEQHKRTLEGYLKRSADRLHFSTSADYKIAERFDNLAVELVA